MYSLVSALERKNNEFVAFAGVLELEVGTLHVCYLFFNCRYNLHLNINLKIKKFKVIISLNLIFNVNICL